MSSRFDLCFNDAFACSRQETGHDRGTRVTDQRSYGLVDSDLPSGRMALLNPLILETTMQQVANRPEQAAIRIDLGAIFVSMELSRSSWLITSLSPGGGEKMSKHSLRGGDVAGLLDLFATLQEKARARTGERFRIIVIQEAGLAGC